MAELSLVHVGHWPIEFPQELQSLRGDARENHAAVFGFAAPRDQRALFEAVEQAGDVGVAGDHTLGNLAARQTFGRASQDAENVVLDRGHVAGPEDLLDVAGEQLRRTHQANEGVFFGTSEAADGFGGMFHLSSPYNTRYNDYCQHDI